MLKRLGSRPATTAGLGGDTGPPGPVVAGPGPLSCERKSRPGSSKALINRCPELSDRITLIGCCRHVKNAGQACLVAVVARRMSPVAPGGHMASPRENRRRAGVAVSGAAAMLILMVSSVVSVVIVVTASTGTGGETSEVSSREKIQLAKAADPVSSPTQGTLQAPVVSVSPPPSSSAESHPATSPDPARPVQAGRADVLQPGQQLEVQQVRERKAND